MKVEEIKGLPTMVMYPVCNYNITASSDMYKLSYTLKKDDKGKVINQTIYKEEDCTTVVIPDITNGLLNEGTYPGLENDQLFAPVYVEVKDNVVTVVGRVIVLNKEE